MDWNGVNRRVSNISLQDILLEVREVKKDVQYLTQKVDQHLTDDKTAFAKMELKFEESEKDKEVIKRCIWVATGAIMMSEIILLNWGKWKIPGS